MDCASNLGVEIHRVVSSPYPVSLKNLHDALRSSDVAAVRESVSNLQISQIGKLAAAIRDALSQYSYSTYILERLSSAVAFRDSLIRLEPTLLDFLLSKALGTENAFQKFSPACIALLSEPLPEDVPLPASAQSFFVCIFKQALKASGIEAIRPVSVLLDGACHNFADILLKDEKNKLLNYLYLFMKKITANAQLLQSECLWIIFKMGASSSTQYIEDDARPSSPPWNLEMAKDYFTGNKALISIRMLVLAVVWVCKGDANLSTYKSGQYLKMAVDVIQAVDPEDRQAWAKREPQYLDKLISKATTEGMHPETQLFALTFTAMFANESKLPRLASVLERTLLSLQSITDEERAVNRVLSTALTKFSPHLSREFFVRLLRRILDAVDNVSTTPKAIRVLLQLLSHFETNIHSSAHIRGGFLQASDVVRTSLENFVRSVAVTPNLDALQIAESATALKENLSRAICSLLLNGTLSAAPDEPSLEATLARSLLQKQQALCRPLKAVKPAVPLQPLTELSLFQEGCTPLPTGLDWRDQLRFTLASETRHREELIIRNMTQSFHDLEERCNNVERPLREEQERSKELESKYNEMCTHTAGLESQILDQGLRIRSLEDEKAEADSKLRELEENIGDREISLTKAGSKIETLLQRVEDLQAQLTKNQEDAKSALDSLRNEHEDTKLEWEAIIVAKQETLDERERTVAHLQINIDELHASVNDLQTSAQGLRDALGRTEQQNLQLNGTTAQLEGQLADAEKNLHRKCTALEQMHVENETLQLDKTALNKEVSNLRTTVSDGEEHLKAAEAKYEALKESSSIELQSLQAQHEASMNAAVERATKIKSDLESELETLRATVTNLQSNLNQTSAELSEIRKELTVAKDEVKSFMEICEEKDAELAELCEFKEQAERAMGALFNFGNNKNTNMPPAGATRRSKRPSMNHPITPNRPEKNTVNFASERIAELEVPSHDPGALLDGSSPKGGPTPKRTKLLQARQSLKVPTVNQPRSSARMRSSMPAEGTRPAMKRAPLSDVSEERANRSPVRRTRFTMDAVESKALRVEPPYEFGTQPASTAENFSFDGSDIFSSTPLIPGSVNLRRNSAPEDDTTMDL